MPCEGRSIALSQTCFQSPTFNDSGGFSFQVETYLKWSKWKKLMVILVCALFNTSSLDVISEEPQIGHLLWPNVDRAIPTHK